MMVEMRHKGRASFAPFVPDIIRQRGEKENAQIPVSV